MFFVILLCLSENSFYIFTFKRGYSILKNHACYHRFLKTYIYLYLIGKFMVQNSQGTKRYRIKSIFSHIYPLNTSFSYPKTTNIITFLCILSELLYEYICPIYTNYIHIVLCLAFHLIDLRTYSLSVI